MGSGDNKYSRNNLPSEDLKTGTNNNNVFLRVSNLAKSFKTSDGKLDILKGIELDLQKGEMISIVGASGAGKSTLLYLLSGLDKPSDGAIYYDGKNIVNLSQDDLASFRNKNVGFVYQFHYLLSEFSALENVMIPLLISGKDKEHAQKDAYNLLEKVGLRDRTDHRPGKLSGGEQQRVAVARALANSPRIVFADEPSGNLDESTADELHKLLADINKEMEITFVIATHNRSLAEKTQKIYELSAGQLRLQ